MDAGLYNLLDARTDVQSLIHTISLLGDDLVGLELGLHKAESFCTLLQNCPNIKTLYGVDNWQPYTDYLREPYDGSPVRSALEKDVKYFRFCAYHHIEFSGYKEKAKILEMDSNLAIDHFQDQSLDFVFMDTYLTREQAINDVDAWYCKVKVGGLYSGHDWSSSVVQEAVYSFREKNKIDSKLSTFDNVWVWKKEK